MLKTRSTEAFDTGIDSTCCNSLSKLGAETDWKKSAPFFSSVTLKTSHISADY